MNFNFDFQLNSLFYILIFKMTEGRIVSQRRSNVSRVESSHARVGSSRIVSKVELSDIPIKFPCSKTTNGRKRAHGQMFPLDFFGNSSITAISKFETIY